MKFLFKLSSYFVGSFTHLPRPIWAIFFLQIMLRSGDFVAPLLTMMLTQRLGLTVAATSLWVSASFVAGVLGTIVAGKLGDEWSRRDAMAICMGVTALLYLICGSLPPSMLIPKLIILTSLFQGAIRPLIQAIIMDHCRIEDRKASYSLTYLGINLGAAVGFASAGLLFQKHPTWIFFISSIAVMGSLFVLMRWVPREGLHVTASHALEKAVSGNAFKAFLYWERIQN